MAGASEACLVLIRVFGPTGPEFARAGLEVLERLRRSERGLTMHELGQIMDGLESAEVDEDVWDLLVRSGLCEAAGNALRLVPERRLRDPIRPISVTVGEVLDVLGSPERREVQPPSTAGDLVSCVRRVQRWAVELLRQAAQDDLPGFPVFWQRDDGGNQPLGRNVGSMAATDTVVLALEPERFGWPSGISIEATALIERAWRQLLDLGIDDAGSWYDGAISFPEFDDDFVGSFLPQRAALGSCPTTEAVANRASGLLALLRSGPSLPELEARSLLAVDRAIGCLIRWQDASGGWGIHRYPPGREHPVPLRDVSCQYAVDALVDAIHDERLSESRTMAARLALRRFADHLVSSARVDSSRVWWLGDFVVNNDNDRLRTTTLVGLVIGKMADVLDDDRLRDLQRGLVSAIGSTWVPRVDATFESQFRSPTWEGAALSAFTWDMVRDAFVVGALLEHERREGPLEDAVAHWVQYAIDGVLRSEFDGSWLDVPMAREGRRRAFVSNSLHTVRAVLAAAAWTRRALPNDIGPGW